MFTPTDFMQPIQAFITAIATDMFPQDIATPIVVNYQTIDPDSEMVRQTNGQGLAVAQVGIDTPNRSTDVIGLETIVTRQANYLIIIRRQMSEDEWRRNTGDFIQNMANRIEYENVMRGTTEEHPLLPHFSDTQKEAIWCNGGIETLSEVEPNVVENALNLILTYDLIFERPY